MHHNLFLVAGSGGVKGVAPLADKPSKFAQLVIIFGVNEGEFAAGNRDLPDGRWAFFEGFARIEIDAARVEVETAICADISPFLLAYQNRPADTDYPSGKTAVITTNMIRIAYVVMRISYCRFPVISHRDHKEKTLTADYADYTDL